MSSYDFSYAKRGLAVRLAYLGFASLYYALSMFGSKNRAVVLCYHAVTDAQKQQFLWQMRKLKNRVINLDQLNAGKIKKNSVCITFDDAFECLLENAIPVAEDCGVDIAIFAVSENMGSAPKWGMDDNRGDTNEKIMTYDELVAVSKHPRCLIGSHTATHPKLASLQYGRVREELGGSKEKLGTVLGVDIDYLAFPHGSYNDLVVETAQDVGYKAVFSLDERCVGSGAKRYILGRFSASPDMWRLEFLLTVEGAYAWLYGWRRLLRRVRRQLAGAA